ncbi:MAG TPA: adenylate/guanylate cyclase domain-containing protein [Spirochaetota bacterium]|nr:adenylate/guanylate cyclase domain-containing protein [Spirochaetota bacterium]
MMKIDFISREQSEDFQNDICIINLRRMLYALLIYLPFNVMEFYYTFEHAPCIVFLPHVVVTGSMIVLYVAMYYAFGFGKLKKTGLFHRILPSVLLYVFIINASITQYHNYNIRNMTSFLALLYLLVSAFFFFRTLEYLGAMALSLGIFVFLMVGTGHDSFRLFPHLSTVGVAAPIGFVFSRLVYQSYKKNFIYLQTINTQKKELEELNQNLERKVGEQLSVLLKSDRLKKYLPAQLVDAVLRGEGDGAGAGAQRVKLSIFFSDIRDFTSTTDSMESEELTSLLNNYLAEMTEIALKWGGTIDKFIGDAIMIFFGAPDFTDDRDHALRCVKMAVEMQLRMRELQSKWFGMGIEKPLSIRIGINTGVATVGNFGAPDRLSYTAIGGQVNIASRLEGECPPNSILISHPTFALVQDEVRCAGPMTLHLKGIAREVLAYQVEVPGASS